MYFLRKYLTAVPLPLSGWKRKLCPKKHLDKFMIGHLHLKNWRLAGLAGHWPRSSASSSWSLAKFLIIYFTTVILSLEDVALRFFPLKSLTRTWLLRNHLTSVPLPLSGWKRKLCPKKHLDKFMIGHLHLKNWRLAGLAGLCATSSASPSWSLAKLLIIYFTTAILLLEDVAFCFFLLNPWLGRNSWENILPLCHCPYRAESGSYAQKNTWISLW